MSSCLGKLIHNCMREGIGSEDSNLHWYLRWIAAPS